MSLDRRMQFFIEQVFPLIWDRYGIPVESTYPPKPSDFKCKDIPPSLIKLCEKAIWIQSKILYHHFVEYTRKNYDKMVSDRKTFVMYVTYACHIVTINTDDYFERFVMACSLVAGFGANFFFGGNGEAIRYIPKILAVYFEKTILEKFNLRGGWKRLEKYLSQQEYLIWYDEAEVDSHETNKDRKLGRELNFSKRVSVAILCAYSADYNIDTMNERYIENDRVANVVTQEVMKYFPEATSSVEESQPAKVCIDDEAKKRIVNNLVEFINRSRNALVMNQQTENDESNIRRHLPEIIELQNDPGKTGVDDSSSNRNTKNETLEKNEFNVQLPAASTTKQKKKKKRGATTSSIPKSVEESSIQLTSKRLKCSTSICDNNQSSKEDGPNAKIETLEKNESSDVPILAVPTIKQTKKERAATISYIQQSEKIEQKNPEEIEQKNPEEIEQKNPVEIEQKNPVEIEQKNPLEIEQKNPLEIEQKNPEEIEQKNPEEIEQKNPLEIEQKNPDEIGDEIAVENQDSSDESSEQTSYDVEGFESAAFEDRPTEDIKKIEHEVERDDDMEDDDDKVDEPSTEDFVEKILILTEIHDTLADMHKFYVDQLLIEKDSDQKELADVTNNESLPSHQELPQEKPKKTFKKKQGGSSSTRTKTKFIGSKREAVAEIKDITAALVPKLEEFAVVIASFLWDFKHDI